MLESPRHGWSQITIGGWSDRCSYLDDVPFLLLEAMKELFFTSKPVSVDLDAEGWEYTIVFDLFETHIITDTDDGFSVKTIKVTHEEIAQELIADIRRDIIGWSHWDYCDMTDEQLCARERALLALCDTIEAYLRPENSSNDKPQRKGHRKTGRAYRRRMSIQKKKQLMKTMTCGYNPAVGYIDWGYKNGVYQPVGSHIKYPKNSNAQAYLKRRSNKIIRRSDVQSGGAYKKLFDYWWMLY